MTGGASGLVQGGLGGPEEVFSRAEVESGRIEHHADTQPRPDPKEIEPSSLNAEKGNDHG